MQSYIDSTTKSNYKTDTDVKKTSTLTSPLVWAVMLIFVVVAVADTVAHPGQR